jgi:CNT family concentrative nucleoside transporter
MEPRPTASEPSAAAPVSSTPDPTLRFVLAGGACALAGLAYLIQDVAGPRGQGAVGLIAFLAIVAACSTNIRAINWRTVGWGMALQWLLAIFILRFEVGGTRPGYVLFERTGAAVRQFLEFTNAGSEFVFGGLADAEVMSKLFPGGFVFAFTALPTIIFASSFFTILYHFGILQVVVRLMARVMVYLMRTSGAETLSATANVFLGQTEAPIIVKPYVPGMTRSEMLALMVGGMATISGGMMAVYVGLGADPIAILTTSVMAAPCGLYISKMLYPETGEPETRGTIRADVEKQHANVVDAAAAGASDGTMLAINVAAMLIAFLALIALIDYLLGAVSPGLSLARIFSWVFAPLAVLMGTPRADVPAMADMLGTKLVTNEFVAFVKLTSEYKDVVSERSYALATFALTGFANLGSVGIQLGGIGAMAPTRRGDLARLSSRALFGGFMATLVNACIASILL